jgi:hypothetical protein
MCNSSAAERVPILAGSDYRKKSKVVGVVVALIYYQKCIATGVFAETVVFAVPRLV